MSLQKRIAILTLMAASASAWASGPKAPMHARQSYSFSCPSGSSGQLTSVEDVGYDSIDTELSLWVNGRYIQSDPKVVAALRGKEIRQFRGGCDGNKTTVLVLVSDKGSISAGKPSWVTVLVDRTGQVIWVGV